MPYGHGHGPRPGSGKATAALVLGITSIVFMGFGLILGIIGLVMATSARKDGFVGGTATAGLVLSIVGVVFSGLFVACVGCAVCAEIMFW
jgi:hypothetical protein